MIDTNEFWALVRVYSDMACLPAPLEPEIRVYGHPGKVTATLAWPCGEVLRGVGAEPVAALSALADRVAEGVVSARRSITTMMQHEDGPLVTASSFEEADGPGVDGCAWWQVDEVTYAARARYTPVVMGRTPGEAIEGAICADRDWVLRQQGLVAIAETLNDELLDDAVKAARVRAYEEHMCLGSSADQLWIISDNEEWGYGGFYEVYGTRADALAAAYDALVPGEGSMWVGRRVPFRLTHFLNADTIEDWATERISDETGAYEHMRAEDVWVDFDDATKATIDAFLDGFSPHIQVWDVVDVQEVPGLDDDATLTAEV